MINNRVRPSFEQYKDKQSSDENNLLQQNKISRKKVKLEENIMIPFSQTNIQKPNHQYVSANKSFPWITKKTTQIKDSLLRFHNEIIDFYSYISPSKAVHQNRKNIFKQIKEIILQSNPQVKVLAFGSFATQLYLPDGDIDVAVIGNEEDTKNIYDSIYHHIREKVNIIQQLQYIRKSKVPLIKFICNGIQFDVSVNKIDGLSQLQQVDKMGRNFPEFKYMVFVFKCMLKIRGLADTYTGGLGSFLLFCMILHYLKSIHSKKKYYTLGEHILNFMEYFSISNNWENKIVYIDCTQSRQQDKVCFSFMSPQDITHDIGKSAFKIRDIFNVFKNRYRLIRGKNFVQKQSILKELINPNGQIFMYDKQEQH